MRLLTEFLKKYSKAIHIHINNISIYDHNGKKLFFIMRYLNYSYF